MRVASRCNKVIEKLKLIADMKRRKVSFYKTPKHLTFLLGALKLHGNENKQRAGETHTRAESVMEESSEKYKVFFG